MPEHLGSGCCFFGTDRTQPKRGPDTVEIAHAEADAKVGDDGGLEVVRGKVGVSLTLRDDPLLDRRKQFVGVAVTAVADSGLGVKGSALAQAIDRGPTDGEAEGSCGLAPGATSFQFGQERSTSGTSL